MRAKLAFVAVLVPALLVFAVAAQARPTPLANQAAAEIADEMAIYTGPAGATLESNYFRAPQPEFAGGRIFPCRLQLRVFEKTRLAQSCN